MNETGAEINVEKLALMRKVLDPERVRVMAATTKREALLTLIASLSTSPGIGDKQELEQAIFRREELMSTGIGLGLAVPHVRLTSVRETVMAVGISPQGLTDYEALDDQPVHLVFMIAAPEGQHVEYLRLLSAISSSAKALNGVLLHCRDAAEFYTVLLNGNPADPH